MDQPEITVKKSVAIPLLQSLISGLLVALFVVTAYSLATLPTLWRMFWFISCLVCLVCWTVILITDLRRGAGEQVETSVIYPAEAQPLKVEMIARDPQSVYQRGKFLSLPIDPNKGYEAALHYQQTEDFTIDNMSGKGNPLSRSEFTTLRSYMIKNGLAFWVDPDAHNQGAALTLAGANLFKRIVRKGKTHTHTRAHERDIKDD